MAHDTNVIVPETGNLHKMMEILEGIEARQKELKKASGDTTQAYDGMARTVEALSARCDELDKKLPRGAKIFVGDTPSKTEALYNFGRCITEAWRMKEYGRMSKEFTELQRDITQGGQMEDATKGTGNVVVPQLYYPGIARIIGEASIIRRIATILPMTQPTMNLPTKGTGPTVYWPNEGRVPTKTSVNLSQKVLTAKNMMALDEVTADLQEDSIVALEPFFAQVFAEAVAAEENQQAFSSTTPFQGVGNDAGITIKYAGGSATSLSNTYAEVSHADLVSLQFGVNSKLINKGVFILSASAFGNIVAMRDSQNRPIYQTSWNALPTVDNQPDMLNASATQIMGRPAFLTDALQASPENSQLFAIYGDFSRFAFGDLRQLSIDWSDQVYFESGNLALRVKERIGMVTLIPSAFCNLKTAA